MQQLELSSLVGHRGVAPDQLADTGRVDRGHFLHVDQDVLLAFLDQFVDRFAKLHVAGTDRDLAFQIQNLDAAGSLAHARLHPYPSFFSSRVRCFARKISMPPPSTGRKRTSSMNVFM